MATDQTVAVVAVTVAAVTVIVAVAAVTAVGGSGRQRCWREVVALVGGVAKALAPQEVLAGGRGAVGRWWRWLVVC